MYSRYAKSEDKSEEPSAKTESTPIIEKETPGNADKSPTDIAKPFGNSDTILIMLLLLLLLDGKDNMEIVLLLITLMFM